jgi:hypothetical protein
MASWMELKYGSVQRQSAEGSNRILLAALTSSAY